MAKPGSSARPTSRLPSTRESRPALIGLAVVLIVGGALASAWLALQAGNRAYFVQVDSEIAQSSEITESDLTKVSLPEDFDDGIPADQIDDVIGQAAATRLPSGTILTRDMVSSESGIESDEARVTIDVEASSFIRSQKPGAHLTLSLGGSSESGREEIPAELVSIDSDDDEDITGVSGDTIQLVVAFDDSCFSAVSEAIENDAVTPAVTSGQNTGITHSCKS